MERDVRAFAKGRIHCEMPYVTRLGRNKKYNKNQLRMGITEYMPFYKMEGTRKKCN